MRGQPHEMDNFKCYGREFENRYQGFILDAVSKERTQEGDVATSGLEEGLYLVSNQAWVHMLMARSEIKLVTLSRLFVPSGGCFPGGRQEGWKFAKALIVQ